MAPSSDSISSLVQEAYDEPVPAKFTAFMDFNRDTLSDLISRHVRVLQRRKPDLEDHQLTIYDKALLHLTRNGNDLTFSPAVLLFCQEYLGIDEEDINETRTLLDQYTMLPTPIDQASTVVGSQRDSFVKTEPNVPGAFPFDSRQTDPAFQRLMAVYEQARSEYLKVADHNDYNTISAAKFLRDTVENVVHDLKGKDIDPGKHAELETMARMAKDTVESLCGGRKRKFDREKPANVRHSPRPSTSSSNRSKPSPRDEYPYHPRGLRNDERRVGRERSPPRFREYARERTPDRLRIPYGYTRPVDTYYPA